MADEQIAARLAAEWDALSVGPVLTAQAIAEMSGRERASRVALIAELQDLRLAVADIGAEIVARGHLHAPATRAWDVKDVLAHLASWSMQARSELQTLLAGESFDYTIHFEREGGPRTWNQREVELRKTRTVDELVAELERETELTCDLVLDAPESMLRSVVELPHIAGEPPQPWRMPLAAMVVMICWHARLHLRALERIVRAG